MSKSYCITMELTQRVARPVMADDDGAAVDNAELVFRQVIGDDGAFEDADMETVWALDAAGGRNVVPWTRPVTVEYPDAPDRPAPSEDDPVPVTGAYILTVERTTLIAEWFEARNPKEAETTAARIMDSYNADPRKFSAGYHDHDYALTSPEGTEVVPWA